MPPAHEILPARRPAVCVRGADSWLFGIMCDMKVSPPFAVDRTSALSLIAQVSEGFRRAIESGVYSLGDVLPNMEDISAAAGVSMMVTRSAIRRLAADG